MFIPAMLVFAAARGSNSDGVFFFIFLIIILLLLMNRRRRRTRYIPVKSKRLAQAELFKKHYSDPETATKPLRLRHFEYDHKHPFSRGGSADPENIQLITRKENRRKGNRTRPKT
jgi:5-methylcytosine-specific restriction endonuclease McrA